MKFIRSVPIALCGLALALAALGNLLLPHGMALRYACGILSAMILILVILKIFLDFPHAREELKTPIPLSVLPTATMTLMLLSVYLRPYLGNGVTYLWYATVIVHLWIMMLFFKQFILSFKLGNVFPPWFIAFVGVVTASVTAPAMGAQVIGQAAFFVGFSLYFVALALVIYRMINVKLFPEPAKPTIAIFTAPMSLCIVGYFASFEQRNVTLIYIMLTIAVISYLYTSVKMISLLKIKFYPSYAAFTFPYVISALAFRVGNVFLQGRGIYFLAPIALISEWIAITMVLYVLGHYIRFFRFWLKF